MKVSVYAELDVDDSWNLTFSFESDDGFKYEFTSYEPNLHSSDEWKNLARGETSVYLYSSNSSGLIECDGNDGDMSFECYLTGNGGDVLSKFRVPVSSVTVPLTEAIDFALRKGYEFAEK